MKSGRGFEDLPCQVKGGGHDQPPMRETYAVLVSACLLAGSLAGCVAPASQDDVDPRGPWSGGGHGDHLGDPGAGQPAVTTTSQGEVDPGWPAVEEAAVRPGVKLYDRLTDQLSLTESPGENVRYRMCTAAFVFSSLDNRTLFISTASHCVAGFDLGDRLPIANGQADATVVYCSWGAQTGSESCPSEPGTRRADDLALLRIAPEDRDEVNPAVLEFGGPTGMAAPVETADTVRAYGNSDLRDARQPVAPDTVELMTGDVRNRSTWYTYAEFQPPQLTGDSGAPVIGPDGGAVGLIRDLRGPSTTHGQVHVTNAGITNLPAALDAMETRLGGQVELKTWPLLS